VTDPSVKKLARQMATYSPAAARKTLTDAGFTYKSGKLIDPKGDAVKLDIHVISGWSDWVASNQIITRNLRDIGISSNVALEPDWGAWYPSAYATKFPTLLWQVASTGSPYGYLYANLSQNAFIPKGQDGSATGNWEHFSDATATSQLNQWKVTFAPKKQHQIATKLEKTFLQHLPIIPLFVGPAVVDVQHEVLPLLRQCEELLWGPDLHDLPDNILSSPGSVRAVRAGPNPRGPTTGGRPLLVRPPVYAQEAACAGLPDGSASTSSRSGSR
jgi:hypothetical protein